MGGKISGPVFWIIIAVVVIIIAGIAYKVIFTSNMTVTPQGQAFEDKMRAAHPLRPEGATTAPAPGAAPRAGYPAGTSK